MEQSTSIGQKLNGYQSGKTKTQETTNKNKLESKDNNLLKHELGALGFEAVTNKFINSKLFNESGLSKEDLFHLAAKMVFACRQSLTGYLDPSNFQAISWMLEGLSWASGYKGLSESILKKGFGQKTIIENIAYFLGTKSLYFIIEKIANRAIRLLLEKSNYNPKQKEVINIWSKSFIKVLANTLPKVDLDEKGTLTIKKLSFTSNVSRYYGDGSESHLKNSTHIIRSAPKTNEIINEKGDILQILMQDEIKYNLVGMPRIEEENTYYTYSNKESDEKFNVKVSVHNGKTFIDGPKWLLEKFEKYMQSTPKLDVQNKKDQQEFPELPDFEDPKNQTGILTDSPKVNSLTQKNEDSIFTGVNEFLKKNDPLKIGMGVGCSETPSLENKELKKILEIVKGHGLEVKIINPKGKNIFVLISQAHGSRALPKPWSQSDPMYYAILKNQKNIESIVLDLCKKAKKCLVLHEGTLKREISGQLHTTNWEWFIQNLIQYSNAEDKLYGFGGVVTAKTINPNIEIIGFETDKEFQLTGNKLDKAQNCINNANTVQELEDCNKEFDEAEQYNVKLRGSNHFNMVIKGQKIKGNKQPQIMVYGDAHIDAIEKDLKKKSQDNSISDHAFVILRLPDKRDEMVKIYNFGAVYFLEKKYSSAFDYLIKAIRLNGFNNYLKAFYFLHKSAENLGLNSEILKFYDEAINFKKDKILNEQESFDLGELIYAKIVLKHKLKQFDTMEEDYKNLCKYSSGDKGPIINNIMKTFENYKKENIEMNEDHNDNVDDL